MHSTKCSGPITEVCMYVIVNVIIWELYRNTNKFKKCGLVSLFNFITLG
jgi:hypothetical protein